MNKIKTIALALLCACTVSLSAQEYKASMFGVKSDGSTLNTRSIQKAIDFISEQGGGTLQFFVGRYLTGSVYLKSNVTIQLFEGAILVGVPSVYDYCGPQGAPKAIICAEGQENIAVIGGQYKGEVRRGVIQGQGAAVLESIQTQAGKGNLKGSVDAAKPNLISIKNCTNVKIEGLVLQNPCAGVQSYIDCKNVSLKEQLIDAKEVPGSVGLSFAGCTGLTATECYVDASGTPVVSAGTSTGVQMTKVILPSGKELKYTK